MTDLTIRKPVLKDSRGITSLIRHYSDQGFLLSRTLQQVAESLRDFVICEENGEIIGCCALHLWSDLAEIRSLAVDEKHWRRGIASKLVNACMDEARTIGVEKVFVLTYQPEFFGRFGFAEEKKDKFPQKIWVDCAYCPHFPNCSETAMIVHLD